MNAPAPALAKAPRQIAVVRLADPSEAVAVLSTAFALLLIFFPVLFPQMIVKSWERGQLMPVLMAFSLLLDTCLYLRVAYLQSAKPRPLAAVCLGSLPLIIVAVLGFVLQNAVRQVLASNTHNLQARVAEAILAHTYLTLVSAVFLPFLVIRLLQQFKAGNS